MGARMKPLELELQEVVCFSTQVLEFRPRTSVRTMALLHCWATNPSLHAFPQKHAQLFKGIDAFWGWVSTLHWRYSMLWVNEPALMTLIDSFKRNKSSGWNCNGSPSPVSSFHCKTECVLIRCYQELADVEFLRSMWHLRPAEGRWLLFPMTSSNTCAHWAECQQGSLELIIFTLVFSVCSSLLELCSRSVRYSEARWLLDAQQWIGHPYYPSKAQETSGKEDRKDESARGGRLQ